MKLAVLSLILLAGCATKPTQTTKLPVTKPNSPKPAVLGSGKWQNGIHVGDFCVYCEPTRELIDSNNLEHYEGYSYKEYPIKLPSTYADESIIDGGVEDCPSDQECGSWQGLHILPTPTPLSQTVQAHTDGQSDAFVYRSYRGSGYSADFFYSVNLTVTDSNLYVYSFLADLNGSQGKSPARVEVGTERVDLLTGDEYKRLTDAEAALEQVKREIAKSHGAYPDGVTALPATCRYRDMGCILWNDDAVEGKPADRFEFRDHFILINVPEAK